MTQHNQDLETSTASERSTLELCADQLRQGVRCILRRGHAGDHECHRAETSYPITWKRSD